MIKAMLFDVDGVVVDTGLFSARFTREFGVSWEVLKPFFQGPMKECQRGRADFIEELGKVKSDWGWQGTAAELAEYWFSDIKGSLNRDLLAEIQKIRESGIVCYLATNQESNRAKYLWEDAELSQYFDGIFASCAMGARKPATKFFDLVTAHFELEPSEIVFIDSDSEVVDAAIAFGLQSFLYTSLENLIKDVKH